MLPYMPRPKNGCHHVPSTMEARPSIQNAESDVAVSSGISLVHRVGGRGPSCLPRARAIHNDLPHAEWATFVQTTTRETR
jgi:hypothetical protein